MFGKRVLQGGLKALGFEGVKYCEVEAEVLSKCNPRTDCFQILMSRDLLYPRRVRWSEWSSAISAAIYTVPTPPSAPS